MSAHPRPAEFLPLRPIEVLVLTVLGEGPCHGYAIRSAILADSGGALSVEAGNLYRHLRRLESDGLIEESDSRSAVDERRNAMRLTTLGRRVLAAEIDRLDALVRRARAIGVGTRLRPAADT